MLSARTGLEGEATGRSILFSIKGKNGTLFVRISNTGNPVSFLRSSNDTKAHGDAKTARYYSYIKHQRSVKGPSDFGRPMFV